jgi:hypothetical protein
MWVLRDVAKLSYPQIADLVQRDHSTVMAGVKLATRRKLAPMPTPGGVAQEVADARVLADERERIAVFLEVRATLYTSDAPGISLREAASMIRNGDYADPATWKRVKIR